MSLLLGRVYRAKAVQPYHVYLLFFSPPADRSCVVPSQAARHIHLGHTDSEGRWSVFGQAFRQVNYHICRRWLACYTIGCARCSANLPIF